MYSTSSPTKKWVVEVLSGKRDVIAELLIAAPHLAAALNKKARRARPSDIRLVAIQVRDRPIDVLLCEICVVVPVLLLSHDCCNGVRRVVANGYRNSQMDGWGPVELLVDFPFSSYSH